MPPQTPSDSRARVPATTETEDAAAGGGECAVTAAPPAPTCPVCMEPWTCNGDHRICCIPCGHVYGRSCLERWLHRSAHGTAKCPLCGEQFEDKLITNLYAQGNLWDGCLQELEARCMSIIDSTADKLRAELKEGIAKVHAKLNESIRANEKQAIDQINKPWNEKLAIANAVTLMKDQMKKMAAEQNMTAMELIELMEHSFPQLSLTANPCARLDSENTKAA